MFGGSPSRMLSIWENLDDFFPSLIVTVTIYPGDDVILSFIFPSTVPASSVQTPISAVELVKLLLTIFSISVRSEVFTLKMKMKIMRYESSL